MKDILEENIKHESKIRYNSLLQYYYRGSLTWLQFKEEVAKMNGAAKALLEEADVKPSFRTELERHIYPLDWWLSTHRKPQ